MVSGIVSSVWDVVLCLQGSGASQCRTQFVRQRCTRTWGTQDVTHFQLKKIPTWILRVVKQNSRRAADGTFNIRMKKKTILLSKQLKIKSYSPAILTWNSWFASCECQKNRMQLEGEPHLTQTTEKCQKSQVLQKFSESFAENPVTTSLQGSEVIGPDINYLWHLPRICSLPTFVAVHVQFSGVPLENGKLSLSCLQSFRSLIVYVGPSVCKREWKQSALLQMVY